MKRDLSFVRAPFFLRAFLGAMALAAFLGGCAQATEIVLVVDTDLSVPSELTRIEIDVVNSLSSPIRTTIDLTTTAAPPLPLTLGITSRTRPDADVRVEVRGYLESGEVLVRDVETRLSPGASRMLRVLLARRCVRATCAPTETCDETGCRAVEIAADTLPAWPGAVARLEGEACEPVDEICNLVDDDCDGSTDEMVSLLTDAANCGRCGNACTAGACENGFCMGDRPVSVAAGGAHTCVLREDASISCFGWNAEGQLGSARLTTVSMPLDVPALAGVTDLAPGGSYGCVLDGRGQILCVGDGDDGALGRGDRVDARIYAASMGSGFDDLAAGPRHACAIDTTGAVLCWGEGGAGQTGGASALAPTAVAGIAGATDIGAGLSHSCAVVGGAVLCWGSNARGQLGSASLGGGTPAPVDGLSMASSVALGRDFSCALRTDGHVLCWGANDRGQLGAMTSMTSSTTPVEVLGIADAMAITAAAGGTHACALRASGRVSCWGSNTSGQLGNGMVLPSAAPVDLMNVTGVVSVAAGGLSDDGRGHTCVVLGSGEVRCVGDGTLGQTGQSDLRAVLSTATAVAGLP